MAGYLEMPHAMQAMLADGSLEGWSETVTYPVIRTVPTGMFASRILWRRRKACVCIVVGVVGGDATCEAGGCSRRLYIYSSTRGVGRSKLSHLEIDWRPPIWRGLFHTDTHTFPVQ